MRRRRGPPGLPRLGVPAAVYVLLLDPVTGWWGARARGNNRSLDDYLLDLTGGRPAAAASDDDRADPPIVAITAAR